MRISPWLYTWLLLATALGFCEPTTEFVVKKSDKRTPSSSHMKDEICQKLFDTLQETAQMIRILAEVQEDLLGLSRGDIMDDNCLGACTKKDLASGHEHVLKMHGNIQHAMPEVKKLQQGAKALRTAITKE